MTPIATQVTGPAARTMAAATLLLLAARAARPSGARDHGRRDGSPEADGPIPVLAESLVHGGRTPLAAGAPPLVGTRDKSPRSQESLRSLGWVPPVHPVRLWSHYPTPTA